MQAIIRKDEQAVSPVIATILMVAITVVLAAVLYVMVSGLITSPGSTPKAIGVTVTKSSDGTNWTLLFASVPTGLSQGTTYIVVNSASGGSAMLSTALSSLPGAVVSFGGTAKDYVQYTPVGSLSSTGPVSAGDVVRIGTTLASSTTSTTGYQVQIASGGSILYQGTLQ